VLHEAGEALFALVQGVFGPLLLRFPVRAVARDLGEAAEPAGLVPQRRHDADRPEAAAVLADEPAVVLAPAGG